MRRSITMILAVLLATTSLVAVPPDQINYQAVLRDAADEPINGDVEIVFRFFDARAAGNEILIDAHVATGTGLITVKGGILNVAIGSGELIDGSGPGSYVSPAEVFRDFGEVWLELQIDGELLAPRVKLLSAAFALNADHLDGRDAAGFLDTSAVPQTKTGDLAIGGLDVGGQVTIAGGSPAAGRVLTSSATGLARWQDLPATQANDLGALADRLRTGDPADLPFATLRGFDCSGANTATLSFTAQGASLGTVTGFVGVDRISQTYEYLISIERNDTTLDQEAVVGLNGRLTLQRVGGTTTFSGLITEFGLAGYANGVATYVARLEPRMITMGRSSGYQTFLDSRASDILTRLLSDAGLIPDVVTTSHVYELAMRYEESPLDYFNRLAEGEGLHYHFREDPGEERLLVRKDNTGFTSIPGSFNYYGDLQDPGTGEEFIATFHAQRRVFTGTVTAGGWDYNTKSVASDSATVPGGTGEFREFFADVNSGTLATLRADLGVQREQVRRMERSGTSNVASLKAGHVFTLSDLTTASFGGGHIVTEIRHYAVNDSANSCVSYGNAFSALPSTVEYKSPRRTHPPNVRGPVRAIVTNNQDPDQLGRVKVRFVGDMPATAESGWARIARPSHLGVRRVIPQVDDEVLIDFVRGDPIAPVVIGSLFNGSGGRDLLPHGGELFMVDDTTVQGSGMIGCNGTEPTDPCPQYIYFYDDGTPDNESLSWHDADDRFEFTNDLALGGSEIFLAKDGPEGSRFIYFYDGISATDESLSWNDVADRFDFTNDLNVAGAVEAVGAIKGASLNVGPTGTITAGSLNVALPSQFDSLLTVNGPFSLNGGSLSHSGGVFTFAGSLSAGDASLTGDLTVGGGDITGGTLNIAPTSQLRLSGSTVNISSNNTVVGSNGFVSNMIDEDNNSATSIAGWYHDGSLSNVKKLADLGETGNLRVRGSLTAFVSFDLAESFRAREPVEAGDLVRLDPASPGSVRLTAGAGDPLVIGVVSEKPGIVLGGGSFDAASLSSTWGDEVAALYAEDRAWLREDVLAVRDDLRQALEKIELRETAQDIASPEEADSGAHEIEERVESLCLERFFEERFAPVALAGRVPVKVDASFGVIEPGDALTPSPLPGVAMRATGPGPIVGTALEGLAAGRGKVLAFIHRGQFGAPAVQVADDLDANDEPEESEQEIARDVSAEPGSVRPVVDESTPFTIGRSGSEDGVDVLRVDAQGNVFARGAFHPASMDLAEYFPLSEPASVGDVLVVDPDEPGRYEPGQRAHDPAVVGIVSAEPGVLLGSGIDRISNADPGLAADLAEARRLGDEQLEDEIWAALRTRFRESHAPVALSGTVSCKVDAAYGAIVPGDLLTTSPTRGHAMRAGEPIAGTIVGKALEPIDNGTGTIRVLVMLR